LIHSFSLSPHHATGNDRAFFKAPLERPFEAQPVEGVRLPNIDYDIPIGFVKQTYPWWPFVVKTQEGLPATGEPLLRF
jgi:hypothetical protein